MTAPTSYPYPGAYISEQLQPLVEPTSGLAGESVAAFACNYNIGPIIPTLVTSWQQYILLYGSFAVANQSPLHYAVWSYFNNGGTACYVLRVPNTDAVTASLAMYDVAGTGTANQLFTVYCSFGQNVSGTGAFSGAGPTAITGTPGAFGKNVFVEVVAATGLTAGNTSARVNLNVYYVPGQGQQTLPASPLSQQYLVEQFLSVSTNPQDPRFVQTIVNSPISGSKYIQLVPVANYPVYTAGTTDFATLTPTALTAGSDGSTAPTAVFAATVENMFDQWCPNQVMMMNVPGGFGSAATSPWATMNTATIINGLITWGSQRTGGGVMLFVDGPTPAFPELSSSVAANYAGMAGGSNLSIGSSYAAVFGPYILIVDPASSNPGATRLIGPCASILGMQASVDNIVGTQQFAAGINWGQLNALDVEVRFTPADLTTMFPTNVNAIKMVPGYGFCVFGARTLLQGYPDQYIPVRRVLQKVEHDAITLTQFAMFEPNTPQLWANITTVLTNYLTQQTLANLLGTNNPNSAFSVTCNATNNSQTSAQAGFVYIQIALALGSPVEIMVINVAQMTGQVTANPPIGTTGTNG